MNAVSTCRCWGARFEQQSHCEYFHMKKLAQSKGETQSRDVVSSAGLESLEDSSFIVPSSDFQRYKDIP